MIGYAILGIAMGLGFLFAARRLGGGSLRDDGLSPLVSLVASPSELDREPSPIATQNDVNSINSIDNSIEVYMKDKLGLIKDSEGWSPTVYKDIAGHPTIGYGHKVLPGETFGSISLAEGEALLAKDSGKADKALSNLVTVPLNDSQRAALLSLVYNIGIAAFAKSTLLSKLNKGDTVGAGKEFLKWDKARNPKTKKLEPSLGLFNRRIVERNTFLSEA